jgi:hypothetical protein
MPSLCIGDQVVIKEEAWKKFSGGDPNKPNPGPQIIGPFLLTYLFTKVFYSPALFTGGTKLK